MVGIRGGIGLEFWVDDPLIVINGQSTRNVFVKVRISWVRGDDLTGSGNRSSTIPQALCQC